VYSNDARHARVGYFHDVVSQDWTVVVPREWLAVEPCLPWPAPAAVIEPAAPIRLGTDRLTQPALVDTCMFGTASPMPPWAAILVPSGTPLRIVAEDDQWYGAALQLHGGVVHGWVPRDMGSAERPSRAARIRLDSKQHPGKPVEVMRTLLLPSDKGAQ